MSDAAGEPALHGARGRPTPGAGERSLREQRAAESEVRAALELMPQLVWTTTPDGYHDCYNERW